MAAVLEVFTVPARVTAMAASSGRLCGGSFSIPTARGLRIKSGSMRLRSVAAGRSRRKYGAVVCELPNTATEVPSVNEGTWQPVVLEADVLTLVEFWAPWCGPCRMIEPVIAELAVQYAGKLKCFKLNTDESPKIATQYGIRSIPTVILFKNGEKKEAIIGAVPKTTLATSIEKFLPS